MAVTRSKVPAFRYEITIFSNSSAVHCVSIDFSSGSFFTAYNILNELRKKLLEVERDQNKSVADQLKKRRAMRRDPKFKEKQAALREQWWKKKHKKLQAKGR